MQRPGRRERKRARCCDSNLKSGAATGLHIRKNGLRQAVADVPIASSSSGLSGHGIAFVPRQASAGKEDGPEFPISGIRECGLCIQNCGAIPALE